MKKNILFLLLAITAVSANAQVFSDRDNLKKDTTTKDEYPYLLPIWGKKVAAKGFKLPYSGGLGLNYLYQKSDITVSNLQVGFNHGTMYNMDNIVHFNNATATSQGINIRPDVWVLPFLNVYGILAKSNSSTAIDVDLQIPTDPGVPGGDWKSIASFQTKANFQGTTAGFGLTPTMGIKGCWMAVDMNFTWTDIPQLDKPAFIYVLGPRVGKAFKLHKPDQNLTFWVGGFRLKMSSSTSGSMAIGDLFNTEGIEQKIDNGYAKIDDAQQNVDTWWASLTPAEQQRPGNIAKKEAAEGALAKAEATLDGLSTVVTNAENATVQYSLSKRPTQMWNFLIGSQFQFNRHWMLRAEAGIFGARTQVIAGLQYRFGL